MKRSQINALIQDADLFFRSHHVFLPPFAYWSPLEWSQKGPEVEEIVASRLGWDITDYGLDDFARYGLLLFTLRNGRSRARTIKPFAESKPYAEKVMIAEVGQVHQMHMHPAKIEDIINRGGGVLAMELYLSTAEGDLSDQTVHVSMDGVRRSFPAGTTVALRPGESITLTPRLYHRFWAEEARVLMGEVSSINDDQADNVFYKMIGTGRFAPIQEDQAPLYWLCHEYEKSWCASIQKHDKENS